MLTALSEKQVKQAVTFATLTVSVKIGAKLEEVAKLEAAVQFTVTCTATGEGCEKTRSQNTAPSVSQALSQVTLTPASFADGNSTESQSVVVGVPKDKEGDHFWVSEWGLVDAPEV